jgi:hypothetical protein
MAVLKYLIAEGKLDVSYGTARGEAWRTHSSLLYATTPSSFNNNGSVPLIASAARKYSSARFVADSCRCSIPINNNGRCDLEGQLVPGSDFDGRVRAHPWNSLAEVE